MSEKLHLTGLRENELIEFAEQIGEPKYRAKQIFKGLHERRLLDFNEITDLPKNFRQKLSETATASTLKVESSYVSQDGTRRFLMKTHDGSSRRNRFYSDGKTRYDLFFVAIGLPSKMRFLFNGETRTA